jgi:hypothetical protein
MFFSYSRIFSSSFAFIVHSILYCMYAVVVSAIKFGCVLMNVFGKLSAFATLLFTNI